MVRGDRRRVYPSGGRRGHIPSTPVYRGRRGRLVLSRPPLPKRRGRWWVVSSDSIPPLNNVPVGRFDPSFALDHVVDELYLILVEVTRTDLSQRNNRFVLECSITYHLRYFSEQILPSIILYVIPLETPGLRIPTDVG